MKRRYVFIILVLVLSALFCSVELNAQVAPKEVQTLVSPENGKSVDQHFGESRSLFVNIIPETACIFLNESFSLAGLIEAGGYTEVQWITIDGVGYFSNENILETEYFPALFDIYMNGVQLVVVVSDGSQSASDMVLLKVYDFSAGQSGQICAGQDFQLQGSLPDEGIPFWTTSGDGQFSDPSISAPLYTPGPNDISEGWVQLSLTVTIDSPCNISGTSSTDLFIISTPTLMIDLEDAEVEVGQSITLSVFAENADGYQWYGPQGLIEGAVAPGYDIYWATPDDAGQYYCEFYNTCGTEQSSVATLTVYQLHTIDFQTGWSGVSSWISPFDKQIENLFQPVVGDLIVLQNNIGTYNPEAGINTLENWSAQAGYQVKFEAPVSLAVKGLANENQSVILNPGWNYLPVISSCNVDVSAVFGDVTSVKMIKDIAGLELFWPDFNVTTLQTLHPGKAYLINVNSETTIVFPSCNP